MPNNHENSPEDAGVPITRVTARRGTYPTNSDSVEHSSAIDARTPRGQRPPATQGSCGVSRPVLQLHCAAGHPWYRPVVRGRVPEFCPGHEEAAAVVRRATRTAATIQSLKLENQQLRRLVAQALGA